MNKYLQIDEKRLSESTISTSERKSMRNAQQFSLNTQPSSKAVSNLQLSEQKSTPNSKKLLDTLEK